MQDHYVTAGVYYIIVILNYDINALKQLYH